MSKLLKAAVYYASLGWQVFPLAPGQKTPITSHGVKDAISDESQIRKWWTQWPNANIGLACGSKSGIYVVDIDVREGINGFESLKEFPELPRTVCQHTPSGGCHYLYRSTVAPANRNSFRAGIDVRGEGYYIVITPSTGPTRGDYRWALGLAPWEIETCEYPDFMRPTTRAPWSVPTAKSTVKDTSADAGIAVSRAAAYLQTCDTAIQGQGGHDKLLYAASRMIHGFLLSDSQTYDLLVREYNPRCVPPWDFSIQKDEKDFRRKISEARRLPQKNSEGWLLNDTSYSPNTSGCVCDIDLDSLVPRRDAPQVQTLVSSDQEYAFLIKPPGLLGEICSWINSTAIKEQPFLSLACSLSFLGALFGRRVRDELGSRTNLYCMGVAPSSAGKAHAMNQIRRLATASGSTSLLGGDDIASDSAIEDRVHREPSTLFMWDEIGHLLAHIKSGISQHHAQVVSLLMKLYSAAGNIYLGKEYAEKEKQRLIVQPCCSIYGTSTMERFSAGISPIELQDGWLSRCLVFCAPFDTPKKRGRIESSVPNDLSEKVKSWATRVITPPGRPELSHFVNPTGQTQAPVQIVVPTSHEAEKVFIQFDNESIEYGKQNPLLACLWAKGEENARRIALIVACGINYSKPHIGVDVASYACRLVRYILMDFGTLIAPEIVGSKIEGDKRVVLKAIESFGVKGATRRDLTRKTQKLSKRDRDSIIGDLMESGDIAFSMDDDKVKTYRYWTAEQYAKKFSK